MFVSLHPFSFHIDPALLLFALNIAAREMQRRRGRGQ